MMNEDFVFWQILCKFDLNQWLVIYIGHLSRVFSSSNLHKTKTIIVAILSTKSKKILLDDFVAASHKTDFKYILYQ